MIANLSRRERVLLLILFIFAVVGGYYYFIYVPAQERIAILEDEHFAAEEALFRDQMRVEQLPRLEEEYEEIKWQVDSLYASVPSELRVSDFLDDLEQIGRRLDIRFQIFRPQESERPSELYGTKDYRLTIQGPYDRVLLFLTALEEFQQPLEIQFIRMSVTGDEGWVNVETVVKSYFLL